MRRLAYCLLSLALAALLGTSALAGVQPTSQCLALDTLVHVRPQGASSLDAMRGKSERKAIKDLRPGDEVLAYAEWQEPGSAQTDSGDKLDARLSYQKVSDLIASHREQRVVHVTLDDGQTIEATDGHPFKTTDGWRDAILLRKGGKLLLKGSGEAATIADVRIEVKTLPVFNIEVANAHTFFVGADGVLVHNGCRNESRWFSSRKRAKDASMKRGGNGIPDGPDKFGKEGHFHDGNHNDKTKPNIHYRWGQRR